MSIKEIHALQNAGQYEAIGPLLAAYATGYLLRHSLVYRNLNFCPDEVRLRNESVFCISPARVDGPGTNLEIAPLILICTNIALPSNELMSMDVYDQATQCIKDAVDRMFLNLASSLVVHDWPPVKEGVEKFFLHFNTMGHMYVEDIRCAVPDWYSGDLKPQRHLTDTLYQVHLMTRLAIAVDSITR